jgi:Flp pilus assembly pilin Flp
MKTMATRFVTDDAGQDLIEYGLLIAIITTACIVAIGTIGGKVAGYFTKLAGLLP